MFENLKRMIKDEEGVATLATLLFEVFSLFTPCGWLLVPPIADTVVCSLFIPLAILLDIVLSFLGALLGCCGLVILGGGGGGLLVLGGGLNHIF